MLKICLMASHAYPPGLGVAFHHEQDSGRVSKDYQPLLPAHGFRQEIIRPDMFHMRPYQWDVPWKPRSGFSASNQFVNVDYSVGKYVLKDIQDASADSVIVSSGIAEGARRELLFQFLTSGSIALDKDGLDPSLLSDLMRLEAAKLHLKLQHSTTLAFGYDNYTELKQSLFFPSESLDFQEPLRNFLQDFLLHPDVSINHDGCIAIKGTVVEMKGLVSVMEELFLARSSTRSGKQQILVPHFEWANTLEVHGDLYGSYLTLETPIAAPMKSPEKFGLRTALKKKNKKKAGRSRDLYKHNYSHACESLLTLLTDKNRNGKTTMNSLKKSGPELPQLLTQLAASIAGTGLAILFSVVCKMACGRATVSSTKLVTTGFGFGLFWLSLAVNKLRDTVVSITKSSSKLDLTEEEMMKRVDKNVNDIFFRGAALMAVAVLRFA